jgi:hypothetical protein
VYQPRSIWHNNSTSHSVYEDGWEIDMFRVIGKALNFLLDVVNFWADLNVKGGNKVENLKGFPFLLVVIFSVGYSPFDNFIDYTHSYLTVRFAWYTPCAVKHQRWSHFFNIFSVNMWICFAFSLVLAVITVSCISYYRNKLHLDESKNYSNIFSVTADILAIALPVSVSTKPLSVPLCLFFGFAAVLQSAVFQVYLTTFLIEPGYEEPIKNREQTLRSGMKFGFPGQYIINVY